jgi:hypothetical protein
MTVVHIDVIHGDHLVRPAPPLAIEARNLISPVVAARTVTAAEGVRLISLGGNPVYVVTNAAVLSLVDARSGRPVARPGPAAIRAIATAGYAGEGRLVDLSLLEEVPAEIRGRKAPIWRAQFSGWNKPTLYFSPDTGELVSRRHELWRVFDFFWMLHIMDYEERENVNNPLLKVMTLLALATALAGAWLLFHAFPRKRRREAR